MKKMDELMNTLKLEDMLSKRDSDRRKKAVIWIFAVIGVAAAIAAIAYVVYQFVCPHCKIDDEFDDDFDEDLFDDDDLFADEEDLEKEEQEEEPVKEEEKAEPESEE